MIAATTAAPSNEPTTLRAPFFAADEDAAREESSESLEDVARQEREYLRDRLREELKREPTEQETDEYLQQHTEGY